MSENVSKYESDFLWTVCVCLVCSVVNTRQSHDPNSGNRVRTLRKCNSFIAIFAHLKKTKTVEQRMVGECAEGSHSVFEENVLHTCVTQSVCDSVKPE